MIDISHPAHVHFFKNFIWEMKRRDHEFIVTARDKDVTLNLLRAYGIEHTAVGKIGIGKLHLTWEWINREKDIYKIARKARPDIMIGIHNPCIAQVSRLIRTKSIIFTDTEHTNIANLVTFPFTDIICTPKCFMNNLGKNHVRYNGYHELAYLYPKYFQPNPAVLDKVRLEESDRYIVLRFVSWQASHDIGYSGLNLRSKRNLINSLQPYGTIFITSEGPIPYEFEKFLIKILPEELHHLLYYATLCIGEGATIASECAVLGTPAIYVNTLRLGYLEEQEKHYGLVYNFSGSEVAQTEALEKAIELLQLKDLKKEWQIKRQRLLDDKIDVTEFMVKFVEEYSQGLKQLHLTNN